MGCTDLWCNACQPGACQSAGHASCCLSHQQLPPAMLYTKAHLIFCFACNFLFYFLKHAYYVKKKNNLSGHQKLWQHLLPHTLQKRLTCAFYTFDEWPTTFFFPLFIMHLKHTTSWETQLSLRFLWIFRIGHTEVSPRYAVNRITRFLIKQTVY